MNLREDNEVTKPDSAHVGFGRCWGGMLNVPVQLHKGVRIRLLAL